MEADIVALLNSSKPDNDILQPLLEFFLADTAYDSDNSSMRDGERNDSDSDSEFNMLQSDLEFAFGDSCISNVDMVAANELEKANTFM